MSEFRSYQDLHVWQRAMGLTESCYRLTAPFPDGERFGMISQIRRSAVSIPANIAEGHGRDSTGAFVQFLRIAQGSLKELETHLLLTIRVELASRTNVAPLLAECDEIGKMLRALIRSLQDKMSTTR